MARGRGNNRNRNHSNDRRTATRKQRFHPYDDSNQQEQQYDNQHQYYESSGRRQPKQQQTSFRSSRHPEDIQRRQQQQAQVDERKGFHPEYAQSISSKPKRKEFAAVVSLLNPDLSLQEDILNPLIQQKKCRIVHTAVVQIPLRSNSSNQKKESKVNEVEVEDGEYEQKEIEVDSNANAMTDEAPQEFREQCLVLSEHPADEHFRKFQERGCRLRYLRPFYPEQQTSSNSNSNPRESHVLHVELRELLEFNPYMVPNDIRKQLNSIIYDMVQMGWIHENDYEIYMSDMPASPHEKWEAYIDLNQHLRAWQVAMLCSWIFENRWYFVRYEKDGVPADYFTRRVRVNYAFKKRTTSIDAAAEHDGAYYYEY